MGWKRQRPIVPLCTRLVTWSGELRTGAECVAAFNARGRKPIDARLPNPRADIKDLIDGQSQTDPRFESERVYCRLSASNVVELLIDRKGYTDLDEGLDHDFKPDAVLIPIGILVPQYDEVLIDEKGIVQMLVKMSQ